MNIDKDTEETARQLFYQLADGVDTKDILAHRNTKAICLILASMKENGLITNLGIDRIITEARN